MLSPRYGDERNARQRLSGIAMLRPAPSGRGSTACAAFMRSSKRMTLSGNGATFFAAMSTCKVMFSEVADTQFSVACSSCSNK